MALIKCYECSREISDLAPACVYCGAPKKKASASLPREATPANTPTSANGGGPPDLMLLTVGAVALVVGIQSGLVGYIADFALLLGTEFTSYLAAGLVSFCLFLGPMIVFGRDK